MPLVTVALFRGEHARCFPGKALVLPAVETAGHADDVGVTELSEGLSCERAADPAGAVDDDRCVVVRYAARNLDLQETTRDVDGPLEGALARTRPVRVRPGQRSRASSGISAASAGSTSVMLERAVFNRSRKLGIASKTLPAWSAFHSLS